MKLHSPRLLAIGFTGGGQDCPERRTYFGRDISIRRYRCSIWLSNKEAAYEVVSPMEAVAVWINKHFDILPYVPFGGAKNSGLGRELGEKGLAKFTQLQVINIAV